MSTWACAMLAAVPLNSKSLRPCASSRNISRPTCKPSSGRSAGSGERDIRVKDRCWWINSHFQGGGNVHPMSAPSIVVRRGAAFGDAVAATCVADKLIDQGYPVIFQTFSPIHSVIRLHPRIADVTDNVGFCHVNLDRAYEDDPHRPQRHFHDMYFDYANRDLGKLSMSIGKPVNCKPHLVFPAQREQTFYEKLRSYPKPWLGICPRSNNYLVRQIPDYTWTAVAAGIHGTCFWLGNHAPAPVGILVVGIRNVDRLTGFLATMDFIVSVDTGPLHIAAALGTRVLAINQSNFLELRL